MPLRARGAGTANSPGHLARTLVVRAYLASELRTPNSARADKVPLRSFKDASGIHWDVWEAHPRLQERRTTDERRVISRPGESPRRDVDRRTSPPATENEGWLVFHSALERRRQRPIVPDWDKLTDVELEKLMQRARPSGPRSRLLE